MSGTVRSRPLSLPRSWPSRVRSAVVQVISLARTSLALTQGWASESLNPELRQRAEGDRSPPGSDVWTKKGRMHWFAYPNR
jgi:hypothetical protein